MGNFRAKVLAPVILVMTVLVAVTVLVVNRCITRQFQANAKSTLTTADAVFRNMQRIHGEDLRLRFHGVVNQPRYYAAFATGDAPTLREPLQKLLANEQDVAIVYYATNADKILASERRDDAVSPVVFASAARAAVQQALRGAECVDIVREDNNLFEVISIPVYDIYNTLLGALTLGSEISDEDARKFSQITHSQIILFAGEHIVASTLPNLIAQTDLAALFLEPPLSNDGRNHPPEVKQVSLGAVHYFYISGQFDSLSSDKSLRYVLLSSYEDSLHALKTTQQVLMAVSLFGILGGTAVIWLLVNRVTSPLRELRDSAEAVGRGDFSRRVPVRSLDECGQLAAAFNRMTENVQQSKEQLEKTVETLNTTQEQLVQSEKLSAVGEFVAGVAHELNNPLTAVMGFSEMMREADVDAKYRRHLDLIYKAAQRCHKIVQSLLSFARRHKPERKAVSVNELIEAVLEILAYQLRTDNIKVVTVLNSNIPPVMADGHQIQQVLLNIINNARQAIEASQHGGKIQISTDVCGQTVLIRIQDDGPGILPENLRRIFDPFFTTKEVGKGTGLGLSLCYGIVKEHGGQIKVDSTPGRGAIFIIELPLAQRPADPSATMDGRPMEQDAREGTGKKVLVVDDEEIILQMLEESLTRRGFQMDAVGDGEAALQRLREERYDLTLCDWKMPGLNGQQIYRRMQSMNPDLCRRVIFITGDVINEQMREFLKSERRPCLTKPFAMSDLHATINAVLAAK